MLLEDDGLDANWEMGTQGDWESDWGLHDRGDSERFGVPRDFDSSINGGVIQTEPRDDTAGEAASVVVRHMALQRFRERLINHFTSRWRAQRVTWPSRNGSRWVPSEQMRLQAAEMGLSL